MDVDKAVHSMIENFKEKTGRSLEEWLAIAGEFKTDKHGEIVSRLKTEFGLTHGYSNMVAHKLKGSDAVPAENKEDHVENQFKGKETLRPIYDKLLSEIMKFGSDIEQAPKNAHVSIRRKKQFAILQAATKTRFDPGLNMRGIDPAGKPEPSGSFNAMCSHRIRLEKPEEITDKVINWIKEAYNQAK